MEHMKELFLSCKIFLSLEVKCYRFNAKERLKISSQKVSFITIKEKL